MGHNYLDIFPISTKLFHAQLESEMLNKKALVTSNPSTLHLCISLFMGM